MTIMDNIDMKENDHFYTFSPFYLLNKFTSIFVF